MNKTNTSLLIVAIVLLLLIGTGGYYFFLNTAPQETPIQVENLQSENQKLQSTDTGAITGRVIYVSDVATTPSFPETEGGISIIPETSFGDFVADLETHSQIELGRNQRDLPHFQVGVPDKIATKHIIAFHQLDESGRFSITLDDGAYVLCLTNIRKPQPDEAPIIFFGCGKTEILAGRTLNLDMSFGEAGFRF